jgi:hypothetical protein
MNTYRLQSAEFVHAPGLIAWDINGYGYKRDQKVMLKIICDTWSSLPPKAAKQLLAKKVPYKIEDETVIFEA